jgi:hypothetical protein
MFAIARKFVAHVVPNVIRPLRILWNELIGFLFLVLAVVGVSSIIRTLKNYDGDFKGFVTLVIAGLFVALMLGYGIFSFLRARKISRS